jgi:hypothetical protein
MSLPRNFHPQNTTPPIDALMLGAAEAEVEAEARVLAHLEDHLRALVQDRVHVIVRALDVRDHDHVAEVVRERVTTTASENGNARRRGRGTIEMWAVELILQHPITLVVDADSLFNLSCHL